MKGFTDLLCLSVYVCPYFIPKNFVKSCSNNFKFLKWPSVDYWVYTIHITRRTARYCSQWKHYCVSCQPKERFNPDETLIFDMNRSIVYKSFALANGWQTIFAFRDSVVAIIALFRWRAENASVKKLPISVQYSFGRQVTYLGALKKFHRLILVHRCHLMTDSSCSTSKFPANISWNWQLAKTVCSPSSSLFSRSSGALGNQLFDEYS